MSRAAAALATVVLLLTAGCGAEGEEPASDPRPSGVAASGDPASDEGAAAVSTPADPTPGDQPTTDQATTAEATSVEPSSTGGGEHSAYGLALLATPEEATHLTLTDFDAIRARLGVPELTSQDVMTDRLEFWRAAEASSVLLTDGLLREENSRYDLTYDFTQDDVDAEARWTGPEGAGFLLALRPELDLELVQTAIDDDAPGLEGANVDRATSTVLRGIASGPVWASNPAMAAVGDIEAESLIVRKGCVPFTTALGVDATVEHQEQILAAHDVEGLLDVEAVAIAFTGMTSTVRLAYPEGPGPDAIETDLAARLALAEDWPTTESIGFADGFGDGAVSGVGTSVGEVTLTVTNPGAAANLALADLVPLGVCADVELLPEPTGL
ncbi:hypothetical protein NF556_02600 [Ornithinimicrobium faecis]|uniref:Uncharacterized protein n=1 Tax=Ornithinimicrobium faecis TaxID=2934158 RepID=A0ABY4YV16_9MICO|nr:hypothetical protein [Ornithinimicrobium sp. HY1793]USQ80573.1 hypothetical protein NF556_02600 [Ornithinimicrobium sp. HY1793]